MGGLELGYKQLSPKMGLVHLWCMCISVFFLVGYKKFGNI